MTTCSSHNLGKFAPSPSVFNFKLLTDVMLKLKKKLFAYDPVTFSSKTCNSLTTKSVYSKKYSFNMA